MCSHLLSLLAEDCRSKVPRFQAKPNRTCPLWARPEGVPEKYYSWLPPSFCWDRVWSFSSFGKRRAVRWRRHPL